MADIAISTALEGIAGVQAGLKQLSGAIGTELPASAKKADAALTQTKSGMTALTSAASTMRGALAGLGVVFGAAQIVSFIGNTFRAADALKAASQAAGIGVEDLQRWRFAARTVRCWRCRDGQRHSAIEQAAW
jgi:hypothetical protein